VPPSLLLIFDLDGTLLDARGAGRAAMTEAFSAVFGVPEAFAGVDFAGQTDLGLLQAAACRHAVATPPAAVAAFAQALESALRRLAPTCGVTALPGAKALLRRLLADPGLGLALGTGNFRSGALVKLAAAGIPLPWLPVGGFGEDGADRAAIVAAAVARARRHYGCPQAPAVVIGDTPYDVAAAHANGLPAIAVATGRYSAQALAACGSEAVLADLTSGAAFYRALAGWRRMPPASPVR
jgi:phosphoglycolate phosphatase